MNFLKDILRKGRAIYIRNRVGTEAVPTCDCVIVVAPHPDDEVFGCAGLMSRSIAEGKQVKLIIMTGGGKSHSGCCNIDEKELIEKRRELTRKAAEVYGLKEENICFLNFSDGEIGQKDEGAILGELTSQKDEKTKSQREEKAKESKFDKVNKNLNYLIVLVAVLIIGTLVFILSKDAQPKNEALETLKHETLKP